jgi:cytochrome c oxidase cbb3-type subunit I
MKSNKAVLYPLIGSCVYLMLGIVLGLLTATKMIWPGVGEFELFSFGRIRMAHTNVVLFGWLLQANIGLLFYIIPKLLHTKLYSQKLALLTWGLYNLAALGGVVSILMGTGNKAIEYAEIAPPFDYIIALAWVLFAINIVMTIRQRQVKYMYVSVWYCVGSLIWTAFVYITGNFVTQLPWITGVNQANLSWFYVHNAVGLVFTPLGVSIAYYLIPKELKTPLYSHKLSLIGFWVISFVYVWTGAHHMIHGPISYWLQTVAILFSFSLIIPVVAVITNFLATFRAAPRDLRMKSAVAKYCYAGTIFYLLTCLQGPFHSIRIVNVYVSKTDWIVGHAHMALLGAFSFFAFAGIYYVLPRVLKRPLFSERLANIHFWTTLLGGIPFFAVLWVSGVIQGMTWADHLDVTFLESLRLMKPYHALRWLSGAAIVGGQLVFLYNIWETLFGVKAPEASDTDSSPRDSSMAEGALA